MAAITELEELLRSMAPQLQDEEYVFCTLKDRQVSYTHLNPLMVFQEKEGITLIITAQAARTAGQDAGQTYRQITLTVHSSLDAVGLTAAVAARLAEHNISANVVAAYFHDHIFVPSEKAHVALRALTDITLGQ